MKKGISTGKVTFGNDNFWAFRKIWEYLRFGSRRGDLTIPQIKIVVLSSFRRKSGGSDAHF